MAHGRIVVDAERCKGCELCLGACPPKVIYLGDFFNGKGYRPAVFEDPDLKCTGCALCAVVCPDVSITVFRDLPERRVREGMVG